MRIKIPEHFAQAVAVSAGAQLGVLPASICFFGTLQTYSLAVNIFLMPVMTLAFISVFISLLLSVIPPLTFTLYISGTIIEALSAAAGFFSQLPFAQIAITQSYFAFILFPLYILVGDFVNLKHKKAVMGGSIAAISALIGLLLII